MSNLTISVDAECCLAQSLSSIISLFEPVLKAFFLKVSSLKILFRKENLMQFLCPTKSDLIKILSLLILVQTSCWIPPPTPGKIVILCRLHSIVRPRCMYRSERTRLTSCSLNFLMYLSATLSDFQNRYAANILKLVSKLFPPFLTAVDC